VRILPIGQLPDEAVRSPPPSSRRRYLQRLFAIETARASLQQQLATAQAEAEEAAAEHTALEEGAKAGEKEKARAARRMTELERKLASLQQKARAPPPPAPALPAPVRTACHVCHTDATATWQAELASPAAIKLREEIRHVTKRKAMQTKSLEKARDHAETARRSRRDREEMPARL